MMALHDKELKTIRHADLPIHRWQNHFEGKGAKII